MNCKRSSLTLCILPPMVLQLALVSCWAQVGSPNESEVSIKEVLMKLATVLPDEPRLEANRMGVLRQETFSVQDLLGVGDRPLQDIEFFEVFPASYTVLDGRIESESVTLDDTPSWLVAFDKHTGRWFLLRGFQPTTAIADFNRLVQALELNLRSGEQALDLFDYYLKVVKGSDYRRSIPTDSLSLQAIASGDYVKRYSIEERTAKFKNWWGRSKAMRRKVGPPVVARQDGCFVISFFRYSEDRVAAETISFAKDGQVVPNPE